jgi:hypothetical protein
MSDTNDTSAIDEKNESTDSTTSGELPPSIKFIISIIVIVLGLFIYFLYGGLILFGCKLAQSNILPTEINCYPYSESKPTIQSIQTNIFTTFTDPPMSKKMSFPYNEYNSKNKIIDLFRDYKKQYNSNFMPNYLISIIESLFVFNYSAINYISNLLNELPEIILVFFGPIIVSIITTIIFLYDFLYLIYLWFSKMSWFFKKNENTDVNGKPDWKYDFMNPISVFCGVGLVILFTIFFFVGLTLGLGFFPLFTMVWCLFTCITYTAEMDGKSVFSYDIVAKLFKYYKVSFMTILCFLLIISAFVNLGVGPGIFALITLLLIYLGVISIDVFKAGVEEGLSPITSYKQAKKSCNSNVTPKSKHGALYDLMFDQFGGGNITKELKNIGKQMANK